MRGFGLRTSGVRQHDHKTVPLCKFHHDELHASGREELYWAMRGVDPMGWIHEQTTKTNSNGD